MGEVSFRPATARDIPALHALVESGYRGESAARGWTHEADLLGGQRTDQDALREIISDPAQTILLAETAGALVGCVLVADKGRQNGLRTAYLGMLTVHPDVQARGLGRELVAQAERHAVQARQASVMEMTVISLRTELIAWYRRQGYALTGRQEPFPDDPRFGVPKVSGLVFEVLAKRLN